MSALSVLGLGLAAKANSPAGLKTVGAQLSVDTAQRHTYNLSPDRLKWLRRATARMREGDQRLRIGFIGASDTSGVNLTSPYDKTVPAYLAASLNAKGLPSRTDSLFFCQPIGAIVDGRTSIGAGWTNIYPHLTTNSTTTNAYTFLPVGNVTRFDLYYYDGGVSSFSWQIDSGSVTTVNCTGANAWVKLTITAGASGAHTLSLKRVSGQVYLGYVEGYDHAVFDASFINFGVGGSILADWVDSNPYAPQRMAKLAACDLYFVNLGPNDMNNGVALATSKTNFQTLITDLKTLNADIVLISPHYTALTASGAQQLAFQDMVKDLAVANGVAMLSIKDRWVSHASADALGYMAADTLHPTKYGYRDIATFVESTVFN